jgi:hypothetical protein
MAGQLLGDGGQQQRREAAGRQEEPRIGRLIGGHRRVCDGVAAETGGIEPQEVACRRPRFGEIGGPLGTRLGRRWIPGPYEELTAVLGFEE